MIEQFLTPDAGQLAALTAFFQVLLIDLVLAGDNAVAVGLAAGGLPAEQRRKVIIWGLAAAVTLRIGFALVTTQLLGIIGLTLAGGLLLLWVCWKMWRELHAQSADDEAAAEQTLDNVDGPPARPAKSFRSALIQVVAADLSMSLDNVLAVAGAAREHPVILVFGLLLSIALMGVAATWIARLLHRYRWIGYVGLAIVLYVALHMIWDGHRLVAIDLKQSDAYNAVAPQALDITPHEIEERESESH